MQVIVLKVLKRSFLGNLFLLFGFVTLFVEFYQWPKPDEVYTKSGAFAGAEYEYTGKSYIFYISLRDGTSFYISTDWNVFNYKDYQAFLSSERRDPSILTIRYISVKRAGALKAVGVWDRNQVYLDEAVGLKDHSEGHITYLCASISFFVLSAICYYCTYLDSQRGRKSKKRRK